MRAKRQANGLLAAGVSVALVVSGCGSSTKHISKAEYLKRGNAICTKGNADIQAAVQAHLKGKPTPAQLAQFVNTYVVPSVQGQINALKALPTPKGDEQTLKALFATVQADLNKAKTNPAQLTGPNSPAFKDSNRRANSYGLTVCGSG